MSRSIKKVTQAEAAKAADALWCAVARAQTREDFGKAFKAFREAITGQGVRYLANLIFMSKTSLNNQENGKFPFKEKEVCDAMRVLGADENTTAACLEHWRRTKDVAPVAQPAVRELPQNTNIETGQQYSAAGTENAPARFTDAEIGDPPSGSISLEYAELAPGEPSRRRHVPRWAFAAAGILCALGGVAVITTTDIGGGLPEVKSSPIASPVTSANNFNNYWSSYIYPQGDASSLCMRPSDDSRVFMSECDLVNRDNLFQRWLFSTPTTSSKESLIENQGTQACLDVAATGEVIEQQCNKSVTSQLWQVDTIRSRNSYGLQFISIYNVGKRGYLTIPNGNISSAIQMIVATYTETGAQRFRVNPRAASKSRDHGWVLR